MKRIKLAISILIPLAVGFLGSLFTTPSIGTWYTTINKPAFNPPDWIFFPVWTTLFILMGISLYLVWENSTKKSGKRSFYIFGIQLTLNLLWSILFFGMHKPLYALIDIAVLWVAILLTLLEFRKFSKTASLLLLPYLAWVTFATVLNFSIVLLN
ncbi:MAG: tryptophan-rich sensory protein [Candidatus Aenigmarchaeota archaeon]|nr:tryptophan-rich sensory protein [Candidatus Aenigmarchaeota archaeon]